MGEVVSLPRSSFYLTRIDEIITLFQGFELWSLVNEITLIPQSPARAVYGYGVPILMLENYKTEALLNISMDDTKLIRTQ